MLQQQQWVGEGKLCSRWIALPKPELTGDTLSHPSILSPYCLFTGLACLALYFSKIAPRARGPKFSLPWHMIYANLFQTLDFWVSSLARREAS